MAFRWHLFVISVVWNIALLPECNGGCTSLDGCIKCICETTSPNDVTCGIIKKYFKACRKGPHQLPTRKYLKCLRDPTCVTTCVENYLLKHSKRCTGTTDQSLITCEDYGRIHKGGRKQCRHVHAVRFGAQVQACCGQECGTCTVKIAAAPEGFTEIFYTESDEHIENPERGFMQYTISPSSNPVPLTEEELDHLRKNDGITLVWRQWNLDLFTSEPKISADFINHIRADFEVIRKARMSAVVRFMYTSVYTGGAPYGDADKPTMTGHIRQLRDVLFEYEELIAVVQAGFIGTWGEWYYTTYFGDPDHLNWTNPDNVRGLTPQNWQDRHDILNELLAAVPENVTVAVRYPQTKYYLLLDETPTQQSDMQATDTKYRISHHNDCFLSSATDVGTYIDYDKEFSYLMKDLQYSTIGGEVCSEDRDGGGRDKCSNAVVEMRELHYTYLNQAYNTVVLDQWKDDGCYADIHKYMGYRLVLQRAFLPDTVASGDDFCFELEISNVGYAAPIRNRDLRIIFRNNSGSMYAAAVGGVDIRTWLSGTTNTVTSGAALNLQPGRYEVLLGFTAQYPTIGNLSDYNILTANIDTAENQLGINNLLHIVEVKGASEDINKDIMSNVCPTVEEFYQEPSHYNRSFCGFQDCGNDTSTTNDQCVVFPILNPSFELTDTSWQQFGDGFVYNIKEASNGTQSINVTNGGALQVLDFETSVRGIRIDADSKGIGISGENSNDYSIYCDVKLYSGIWDYGITAVFNISYLEWQTVSLRYTASEDIDEGWCYAMFRNYQSGVAYFDNFRAFIRPSSADQC